MPEAQRLLSFGVFALDAQTGELRKAGKPVPRLTGQPLAVLLHLIEHPGDLVTRDDLRQRLWPADTFVDYDHSLNAAVNKLREALGDSAENPRFIETIPRRGYRFIAPVAPASRVPAGTPLIAPAGAQVAEPIAAGALLSDARELPPIPRGRARLLFSMIQVLYLSFYVLVLARLDAVADAFALFPGSSWTFLVLVVTAAIGIPIRLYLLTAAAFGYRGLTSRFQKLFPLLFPLDELWALAPFLIVQHIGIGLGLAATAALLFLPFSQRSLLLMGDAGSGHNAGPSGAFK